MVKVHLCVHEDDDVPGIQRHSRETLEISDFVWKHSQSRETKIQEKKEQKKAAKRKQDERTDILNEFLMPMPPDLMAGPASKSRQAQPGVCRCCWPCRIWHSCWLATWSSNHPPQGLSLANHISDTSPLRGTPT